VVSLSPWPQGRYPDDVEAAAFASQARLAKVNEGRQEMRQERNGRAE